MKSDEDGIALYAADLWSKWGFNDGDMPDEVWDALEEEGIDVLHLDWHRVLIDLVRTFLVPRLDVEVELQEIITSHNPIRSVDAGDYSYGDKINEEEPSNVSVFVSMPEVISAANRVLGREAKRAKKYIHRNGVSAIQYRPDLCNCEDVMKFADCNWDLSCEDEDEDDHLAAILHVDTLDGCIELSPGDYLVRDALDRYSKHSPDEFNVQFREAW